MIRDYPEIVPNITPTSSPTTEAVSPPTAPTVFLPPLPVPPPILDSRPIPPPRHPLPPPMTTTHRTTYTPTHSLLRQDRCILPTTTKPAIANRATHPDRRLLREG